MATHSCVLNDCGYLGEISVSETINLYIDDFIDVSNLEQVSSTNFITCDCMSLKNENMADEKYYFWVTKNDLVEITEFDAFAKEIDRLGPQNSIISLLSQKTFVKNALKSFKIRGIYRVGHFLASSFICYLFDFNKFYIYCFGIPIIEQPKYIANLTLKNDQTSLLGEIFSAINSYTSKRLPVIVTKSLVHNGSIYLFCALKDTTCYLVKDKSHGPCFSIDTQHDTDEVCLKQESQASFMVDDKILFGFLALTTRFDMVYIFSHDPKFQTPILELIKSISISDSIISTCFFNNNFVIVKTNSLKISKTDFWPDNSWEPVHVNHSESNTGMLSKLFSFSYSDKAIRRSIEVEEELDATGAIDRFDLAQNIFKNVNSIKDSETVKCLIDQLDKYQSFINHSCECASLLSNNDLLFLYLPQSGIKVIEIDASQFPETKRKLKFIFRYFSLVTNFENILDHKKTQNLLEDIKRDIDTSVKIHEENHRKIFVMFPNMNYGVFDDLRSVTFKDFILSLFPTFHPFLQEPNIYKQSQSDLIFTSFHSQLYLTLIIESSEEMIQVLTTLLYLLVVLEHNDFYDLENIQKSQREVLYKMINTLILFHNLVKNLSIIKIKSHKETSVLIFMINTILAQCKTRRSFSFNTNYIFSKLLNDQRPYLELIKHVPLDVFESIICNLGQIYGQLSEIEGFEYFSHLKHGLLFVRIISCLVNNQSSRIHLLLHKFICTLKTKVSEYFLFEKSSLAILSIIETAFECLNFDNFNKLTFYLIEILKAQNQFTELIPGLMLKQFDSTVRYDKLDESVSIMQRIKDENLLLNSVNVLVNYLLEKSDIRRLTHLNYLNVEPLVFDRLLALCHSSQDISIKISYYDIIIVFLNVRDSYFKASQMSYEIFQHLCQAYLEKHETHFLNGMHHFMSITYHSLKLIGSNGWRFVKSSNVVTSCFWVKKSIILHIEDIKVMLATLGALIQLQQSQINTEFSSISSYSNLNESLIYQFYFDTAIDLCCLLSMPEELYNIITCIIDIYYGIKSDTLDEPVELMLLQRNSICQISQSLLENIEGWFQHIVEHRINHQNEIIVKSAAYILDRNYFLPRFMATYLQKYCPNELIRIYIMHEKLVEASELISDLLHNQLTDSQTPVSLFSIDELTALLMHKIEHLSDKIQLTTSEVYQIQLLISSQQRLTKNLNAFKENCQLKTNSLRH
ncbi:hypothetical protein RF11_07580 [Thelohanellus kitauei]|uniref:Uncharacterized protein n=1 Tax=Thelohanellus kitauei TaxID=669202 RepID=A0A0C2MDB3_THEKT|nr:hypothetical protein RF11_07580 [Thelohanellus kitauei]